MAHISSLTVTHLFYIKNECPLIPSYAYHVCLTISFIYLTYTSISYILVNIFVRITGINMIKIQFSFMSQNKQRDGKNFAAISYRILENSIYTQTYNI